MYKKAFKEFLTDSSLKGAHAETPSILPHSTFYIKQREKSGQSCLLIES